MLRALMPLGATVAVDVVAWAFFHAATGYAAHRLSEQRLAQDGWLLRPRRFEAGGRWYRDRLRIHRWKDRLPEAGALFPGGVSKRHLPPPGPDRLPHFARETRRAELTHWWAMACAPAFAGWNPPVASILMVVYAVTINLPFIVIQRYNRARVESVLARRSRSATPPRAASTAADGSA